MYQSTAISDLLTAIRDVKVERSQILGKTPMLDLAATTKLAIDMPVIIEA